MLKYAKLSDEQKEKLGKRWAERLGIRRYKGRYIGKKGLRYRGFAGLTMPE